jgi:hypothetical protein
MYGTKVELTIGEKKKHNSVIGGCSTIVVALSVLAYGIYLLVGVDRSYKWTLSTTVE